jgi:hypothetical protein
MLGAEAKMSRRARKKRWARYLSGLKQKSRRSAADHRRWWPSPYHCATCGIRYVRLYRGYGGFFHKSEVACNAHLPTPPSWRVPLITACDGGICGYTSSPQADIDRWMALPEAMNGGPTWGPRGWLEARV